MRGNAFEIVGWILLGILFLFMVKQREPGGLTIRCSQRRAALWFAIQPSAPAWLSSSRSAKVYA
jgi:hypothetical protein